MLPPPFQNALVLAGPTASGKSALALELADALDAEIISMDSMSLYRGMDVGTAKPRLDERQRIRHHLIDVLDPWESANVAWWVRRAEDAARDIESRGKRPLIVGGTPLYLKALIAGLFEGPPADPAVRSRLEADAAEHGSAALHARLAAVDPVAGAKLHPNDVRRAIRALEVFETTGKPISEWQQQWTNVDSADDASILWLDLPRAELYERIDRRVAQMFEAGWEDEIRRLRELPHPISKEASQALGYKEWFEMLDGKLGRHEALLRIQTRTRQFAKRQVTWFRHLPGCRPTTVELTRDLWRPKMRHTLREH